MSSKTVNSFKFLPRLIGEVYKTYALPKEGFSPWTPFNKPLSKAKIGLITSGGIYDKRNSEPFDIQREITDPTWGDPSYRIIPRDVKQEDIGISHLHYNHAPVHQDINILLPFHRLNELAEDGVIGDIADYAISFMGYQGYPPNTSKWKNYSAEVSDLFRKEEVDAVLFTPA